MLFEWDNHTIGLHMESPQVVVIPGSLRSIATGNFHVGLRLAPVLCEIQWVSRRHA
jgi:hypothetical protein